MREISGPILLVGNSYSQYGVDPSAEGYPTLACNRALKPRRDGLKFTPTYLMIADREVYIQERDSGRLEEYSKIGKLLLSETIFDPKIKGKRADMNKDREYPAQPVPYFRWHPWRVGSWQVARNFDSFKEYLCSCAGNIVGPMLQAAAILGATKIEVMGVDLTWRPGIPSHIYGDGEEVGAYPPASLPHTLQLLKRTKEELLKRGIEVVNLSPWKITPFAKVFGR